MANDKAICIYWEHTNIKTVQTTKLEIKERLKFFNVNKTVIAGQVIQS